jgi:hypothetical protein
MSVPLRRPRTRGDCVDGPRPCPWVSCHYHLALEVAWATNARTPHVRVLFDPDDWTSDTPTCVLDIADAVATCALEPSVDLVGILLGGIKWQRVAQIQQEAIRKLRVRADYLHIPAG